MIRLAFLSTVLASWSAPALAAGCVSLLASWCHDVAESRERDRCEGCDVLLTSHLDLRKKNLEGASFFLAMFLSFD